MRARKTIIALGVLAVSAAAFLIWERITFDRAAWLADYDHLRTHVSRNYANLLWVIEERDLDPAALHRATLRRLEEARTGLAESLRIRAPREALAGDRLRWLGELFGKHKGACPLTLDYSGSEAKAVLQFGEQWHIDPADNLIQALRDQFGKDNVFLQYR